MGTKCGYWINYFKVRANNASGERLKLLTPIGCWVVLLVLGGFSFFHFFCLGRRLSLKGGQKRVISPERAKQAEPDLHYRLGGLGCHIQRLWASMFFLLAKPVEPSWMSKTESVRGKEPSEMPEKRNQLWLPFLVLRNVSFKLLRWHCLVHKHRRGYTKTPNSCQL